MKFPRELVWVGSCCHVKPSPNKKKEPMGDSYPRVIIDGVCWWGHRLSYNLNKKKIPVGPQSSREGFVLHTCDNKWCVNPEHLYLGTAKQNVIDSYQRASPDRRKRLSEKSKGIPKSETTRKKMAASQVGNSKAKGCIRSEETRSRMSASGAKRWVKIRGEINC